MANIGGQLLNSVSDSIESSQFSVYICVRITWMMCKAGLPPLHISQFFIFSYFFWGGGGGEQGFWGGGEIGTWEE